LIDSVVVGVDVDCAGGSCEEGERRKEEKRDLERKMNADGRDYYTLLFFICISTNFIFICL